MSSVTKSILFPKGFVLWHRIYMAFFINSISCSVKPLPADGAIEEDPLLGSTPPSFLANYSYFYPPAGAFF
jgi:hypothetical protein